MKQITLLVSMIILISSCHTAQQAAISTSPEYQNADTVITQSLFNDKAATISEENIQRVLDGTYKLPQQLRVAIVKLESASQKRSSWYYWSDEQYLKTQQSYLDLFADKFKQSSRVTKVFNIPDVLISRSPSFTNIREAAVRMQADVVVIYSIASDLYSRYKAFSKPDIKAYATTQLIIMDVRTGLIPFSTISTKDALSQKKKEELDNSEAASRIQNEAVLSTITDIGQKISDLLNTK
jgi:hypothetical protein